MNLRQKIKDILIWSQKYTQTDMIYLAKGGFWLTFGKIITSISSFLLAIAFANLLPRETYGTYKYVLSVGGILGILSLPGLNDALTRAVAKGYESSFISCLRSKLRWGTLGGLASLGLAGYYFLNGNTALTICFLITAAFLPLMNAFMLYESFWTGKKSFKILTKYQVIIQLLAASVLIPVLFLTNNLFLILLSWFSAYTTFRFIALWVTLRKVSFDKKQYPEVISYGKHLSLMSIIGSIASQLDRILIWHFLGAIPVAIYHFAIIPPEQIKEFLKKIDVLSFPKLTQKTKQETKSTLPIKTLKLLILIIPIVVVYIFFAPYIYKIFFPKYSDSIIYSQIFALTLLFFPRIFMQTSLVAQGEKEKLYWVRTTTPIVKIALLLVLLPIYGIYGVITAILGTYAFETILSVWLFKRM